MKTSKKNIFLIFGLLLLMTPIVVGCGEHKTDSNAAAPVQQPIVPTDSGAQLPPTAPTPPPSVAHDIAVQQGNSRH